jgi:tetratricopeptide (TPR) repeat protein
MTRNSPQVHLGRVRVALCTIALLGCLLTAEAAAGVDESAARDRYRAEQVSRGARAIPVLARLEYESAVEFAAKGDTDAAEKHLREAIRFDPDCAEAHFALARLNFGRFDSGGLVDLMQGVYSATRSFRNQGRLALGGSAFLSYVLLVVNLVVCLAFSIKYLPYLTHKLSERLQKRYNAAFPRAVSYLILLSPVLFFVDTIIPLAYLVTLCWLSMYRRERVVVVALVAPFVVAGLVDIHVRVAAVVADPKSFTALVDRANNSAADEHLFQSLERTSVSGMEVEKNLSLGLLHLKARRYYDASDYFFQVLSLDPQRTMAYINLGNVHFMQGDYEKALQGYRKAESIDPADPVCQYNLAQAYIKTLLMKEASRSLQLAAGGIEKERTTYAQDAFDAAAVLPKLFSEKDLWRMAVLEAKSLDDDRIARGRAVFPWLPDRLGAAIVLLALVFVVVLNRFVDPASLTFQCSNCGKLTCNDCCSTDRDITLCRDCAKTIESVTSEKVVEALLRQRRQAALIRRRRAARVVTMVLPGVRDVYYGHVSRGVSLAVLFSVSAVCLIAGGNPFHNAADTPLWRFVAATAGTALAYVLSARSKSSTSFKPQRHRSGQRRATESVVASARRTHAA